MQDEHLTLDQAVAPIALGMANHPQLEEFDLSSLRYVMWGATPVAPEVAETVTRRPGVRWLPAYGTSEVPVIACNPVQEPDRWRLDTVGPRASRASPGVQVRIVDPERGEVLPAGETGEIEVLSPSRDGRATSPSRRPRPRSATAGTAPATSGGSNPTGGCTSPTGSRR